MQSIHMKLLKLSKVQPACITLQLRNLPWHPNYSANSLTCLQLQLSHSVPTHTFSDLVDIPCWNLLSIPCPHSLLICSPLPGAFCLLCLRCSSLGSMHRWLLIFMRAKLTPGSIILWIVATHSPKTLLYFLCSTHNYLKVS